MGDLSIVKCECDRHILSQIGVKIVHDTFKKNSKQLDNTLFTSRQKIEVIETL